MVESFYTYLHGPRTFWGNSNKTVINNFFGAPMMQPWQMCGGSMFGIPSFGMPMFGTSLFGGLGGNCCGCNCNNNMNNIFGFMFLNSMLNNTVSNIGMAIASTKGGGGSQHKTNNTSTNNSDKIQNLESELADAKKQIENLKKEKNENKVTEETSKQEKAEKVEKTEKNNPTNNSEKTETLDDKLNKIDGYKDLTQEQKNYVKDKIKSQQTDENGNTTYNINAIAHSGDTLEKIINRFYKEDENHDKTNIQQTDYNTQNSGKTVKYPSVGENITLNGVSNFGLTALAQDAKQNITRESEIQKTNNEIKKLKGDFLNGTHKLSKEYILQNHMMTEAEYNEVIKNKYSN